MMLQQTVHEVFLNSFVNQKVPMSITLNQPIKYQVNAGV